jgi:hypothetical protein
VYHNPCCRLPLQLTPAGRRCCRAVANHGVAPELVARQFEASRRFFAQPLEAKLALRVRLPSAFPPPSLCMPRAASCTQYFTCCSIVTQNLASAKLQSLLLSASPCEAAGRAHFPLWLVLRRRTTPTAGTTHTAWGAPRTLFPRTTARRPSICMVRALIDASLLCALFPTMPLFRWHAHNLLEEMPDPAGQRNQACVHAIERRNYWADSACVPA